MRDSAVGNLRFVCIFAMIFVHVELPGNFSAELQPLLRLAQGDRPVDMVDADFAYYVVMLLRDGLGRISSPLLGLLSGYFVAAALCQRSYRQLVAARFRSLYVPMLVWTLAMVAVRLGPELLRDAIYGSDHFGAALRGFDPATLLGLTTQPLNGPLHYLVDLFICVLLAPALLFAIDRLGFAAFAGLALLGWAGLVAADPQPFGFNFDNALPRADLFLFFCAGVAGQRAGHRDIGSLLDRLAPRHAAAVLALLAVFLAGAMRRRLLGSYDGELMQVADLLLMMSTRVSGCLLILSCLGPIRGLAEAGWTVSERFTFRLFCTHAITFYILQRLSLKGLEHTGLDRSSDSTLVLAAYLAAPALALGAAWLLCQAEDWGGRRLRRAREGAAT